MRSTDKQEFSAILDGLATIYGRQLARAAVEMFWGAVDDLGIEEFRAAANVHARTSKFFPTPAEIRELVSSGQPANALGVDADEAWAIAVQASDERASVVWTDPIRLAWCQVSDLHEEDKVGARMAFKGIYTRLVGEFRARGHVPVWELSAGWDARGRAEAIEAAARLGRLVPDSVMAAFCLPPSVSLAGLLESADSAKAGGASGAESAKIALARLKAMLANDDHKQAAPAERREEQRLELERSRAEQLRKVDEAMAKGSNGGFLEAA